MSTAKRMGFKTYAIVAAAFAPLVFLAISIAAIPVAIYQRDFMGYFERRFAFRSLCLWFVGGVGYYSCLFTLPDRIEFSDDSLFEYHKRFNEGYALFETRIGKWLEENGIDKDAVVGSFQASYHNAPQLNDLFVESMREVGFEVFR